MNNRLPFAKSLIKRPHITRDACIILETVLTWFPHSIKSTFSELFFFRVHCVRHASLAWKVFLDVETCRKRLLSDTRCQLHQHFTNMRAAFLYKNVLRNFSPLTVLLCNFFGVRILVQKAARKMLVKLTLRGNPFVSPDFFFKSQKIVWTSFNLNKTCNHVDYNYNYSYS